MYIYIYVYACKPWLFGLGSNLISPETNPDLSVCLFLFRCCRLWPGLALPCNHRRGVGTPQQKTPVPSKATLGGTKAPPNTDGGLALNTGEAKAPNTGGGHGLAPNTGGGGPSTDDGDTGGGHGLAPNTGGGAPSTAGDDTDVGLRPAPNTGGGAPSAGGRTTGRGAPSVGGGTGGGSPGGGNTGGALDLYCILRRVNPAPYAAFLHVDIAALRTTSEVSWSHPPIHKDSFPFTPYPIDTLPFTRRLLPLRPHCCAARRLGAPHLK